MSGDIIARAVLERGARPLPSAIRLEGVIPLVGTLHRVEREVAAALVVRVCQVRGDVWAPVRPFDVRDQLVADVGAKVEPWAMLNTNPFLRPDFKDLAAAGYATIEKETGAIEFLPKFFEAVRRWWMLPEDPRR